MREPLHQECQVRRIDIRLVLIVPPPISNAHSWFGIDRRKLETLQKQPAFSRLPVASVCKLLRRICKSSSFENGAPVLAEGLQHYNGIHNACRPGCKHGPALPANVVSLIRSVCETVLRAPARYLHGFTTNMVENFNSTILAFTQKRTYEPRAYPYKIMMAYLSQCLPDWKRAVMRRLGIEFATTASTNIDAALAAQQRHHEVAASAPPSRYTLDQRMREANERYTRQQSGVSQEPLPELTLYGEPHKEPRVTRPMCGCKKSCSTRCGCFKASRACTDQCSCPETCYRREGAALQVPERLHVQRMRLLQDNGALRRLVLVLGLRELARPRR